MGDDSVILQGKGGELACEALHSTVHGAGRIMSRTEARGKTHRKTGRVIRPGKVSHQMMEDWLREKDVVLRGGGLDESPHAYRRLPEVLEAQGDTIEVLHTLTPLVVVMAGATSSIHTRTEWRADPEMAQPRSISREGSQPIAEGLSVKAHRR